MRPWLPRACAPSRATRSSNSTPVCMRQVARGWRVRAARPRLRSAWRRSPESRGFSDAAGPSACAFPLRAQVADEILENESDTTKVSLIFANVSEDDILLKQEVDARAAAHPDKLEVRFTSPPPDTRL